LVSIAFSLDFSARRRFEAPSGVTATRTSGYGFETRLVNARAVAFYERRGYARIANYGRYRGNDAAACFGKALRPIVAGNVGVWPSA